MRSAKDGGEGYNSTKYSFTIQAGRRPPEAVYWDRWVWPWDIMWYWTCYKRTEHKHSKSSPSICSCRRGNPLQRSPFLSQVSRWRKSWDQSKGCGTFLQKSNQSLMSTDMTFVAKLQQSCLNFWRVLLPLYLTTGLSVQNLSTLPGR